MASIYFKSFGIHAADQNYDIDAFGHTNTYPSTIDDNYTKKVRIIRLKSLFSRVQCSVQEILATLGIKVAEDYAVLWVLIGSKCTKIDLKTFRFTG